MGGPIQPPGHLQTMVRLLIHGMNPQAVLDAPAMEAQRREIGRSRD
jgi:gamma-glutamyltranspeptidase/glutathione hydrolase